MALFNPQMDTSNFIHRVKKLMVFSICRNHSVIYSAFNV